VYCAEKNQHQKKYSHRLRFENRGLSDAGQRRKTRIKGRTQKKTRPARGPAMAIKHRNSLDAANRKKKKR